MNLSNTLSAIHWLPVVVMTLASFVIGFAWHSKLLFGKSWQKENFPKGMPAKINAPMIFGGTAVFHFIAIAGLSSMISGAGGIEGLKAGLFISAVWILPAMAGTYLFASRSMKLLAIDAGMYIVLFSLVGLVLGAW